MSGHVTSLLLHPCVFDFVWRDMGERYLTEFWRYDKLFAQNQNRLQTKLAQQILHWDVSSKNVDKLLLSKFSFQ